MENLEGFMQVLTESLPQIIAAVISAAIIGATGLLYSRKSHKRNPEDSPIDAATVSKNNPLENVDPVPLDVIDEAEHFMNSVAAGIIRMVRPHQEIDPLSIDTLYDIWRDEHGKDVSKDNFQALLSRLLDQHRLPGIVRRGDDFYIEEEHFSWKSTFAMDDKELIAKEAVKHIKSGDIIVLDAGSTTLHIARRIGNGLRTNLFKNIVIVTNFFKGADELLTIAMEMGLEDDDPMLKIFLVGGRVRLNTLAIVDDDETVDKDVFDNFNNVLKSLGGADVAFLGTNGIVMDVGFTTAEEVEVLSKQSIISHSRQSFIVADPSKFGLQQEQTFATFGSDINIISTKNGDRRILRDYERYFEKTETNLIYAS